MNESSSNQEIKPPPNTRAWYGASLVNFLSTPSNAVFAELAKNPEFDLLTTQKLAWLSQIESLKSNLEGFTGTIFLEFNIPRLGRRIDAVAIIGPIVFVIEFKVGETRAERTSIDQVWDYALDLKNFHEASHDAWIAPILIATGAEHVEVPTIQFDEDKVSRPIFVNNSGLAKTVSMFLNALSGTEISGSTWGASSYRPTPTIIEAARCLYANHSVEAIARYDAGAKNLRLTSHRIEQIIEEAQATGQKVICFVTGVPGAGKTLVGLNIATNRRDEHQTSHAVFLSGNGPLVAVLREALSRDEVARRKARGESIRTGKVRESVKAFIQNVHHFRDDALVDLNPPAERVVIFDEAQRAWNLRQTANFMHRKKNLPGFDQSEPEFLISCMNRHEGWAVVVCLVGGGQEINTGEAGIGAWLEAVNSKFPDWKVCISSKLTDSEYASESAIENVSTAREVDFDDRLHLAVSMRSFRAENVSAFVKALLDCDEDQARSAFTSLVDRYPIVVSRDLTQAKRWVRERARGSERFGIVASSKAQRLKPHAIDIRVDVDPVHWFLNDRDDTRSCYYLEDAATEFQVQGLELDWTCVTWDGDLRFNGSEWTFHDFRGSRWTNVNSADNRTYLRNAYRVLLTRARQGMAIFVPRGDQSDPTRSPSFYDSTFDYLVRLGLPILEGS